MSKTRLDPVDVFLEQALIPDWQPSNAVGYDLQAQPGDEAFLPVGESLADVGETYPHLTVQRTNETAPGASGYNFITTAGPGQDRSGQLLVSARAEQSQDGYTGDSGTHAAVDAGDLVGTLLDMVEDTTLANATARDTDFNTLSSYRGADAPNDYDATPPVVIDQCVVSYSWSRLP